MSINLVSSSSFIHRSCVGLVRAVRKQNAHTFFNSLYKNVTAIANTNIGALQEYTKVSNLLTTNDMT